MNNPESDTIDTLLTLPDEAAIRHLRSAIGAGTHWYVALLEAIGLWSSGEETFPGYHYRYLIDGEAFDWQLLAERLIETVNGLVPENERYAFLLNNQPPLDITKDEFRGYMGDTRYRQHLNFHYGVTVERALVLAVKDEIRKERQVAGYIRDKDTVDEAFRRIYGETESALVTQFRKERRYRRLKSMSLDELKEFTYWLFKYRLKHSDKEKVASDTRKAIEWVNRNGLPVRLQNSGKTVTIDPQ
ncbi:MAG: hypothetical protein Q8O43_07865 [Dehalococcoidia bacterium]|nr:hypothetical protein [Dehalococcoidia bacterium]